MMPQTDEEILRKSLVSLLTEVLQRRQRRAQTRQVFVDFLEDMGNERARYWDQIRREAHLLFVTPDRVR